LSRKTLKKLKVPPKKFKQPDTMFLSNTKTLNDIILINIAQTPCINMKVWYTKNAKLTEYTLITA